MSNRLARNGRKAKRRRVKLVSTVRFPAPGVCARVSLTDYDRRIVVTLYFDDGEKVMASESMGADRLWRHMDHWVDFLIGQTMTHAWH